MDYTTFTSTVIIGILELLAAVWEALSRKAERGSSDIPISR